MSLKSHYSESNENVPVNCQSNEGEHRSKISLTCAQARQQTEHDDGSSKGSWSFSDMDCGNAFHAQRIHIDFSPEEADDDPELKKKCSQFWKFINSQPVLMNMVVNPEDQASSSPVETENRVIPESVAECSYDEISANCLKTTQWLKYKDAVQRSIATSKKEYCDERQYCEDATPTELDNETSKKRAEKKNLVKDNMFVPVTSEFPRSSSVRNLCNEMDEWDANHPKSMEPPCVPQSLGTQQP